MQVRWDSDANMRWNFGYWAALIRHPDAETILTSQLRDADLVVQTKAIEHLGMMGSETALQILKEYGGVSDPTPEQRAGIGMVQQQHNKTTSTLTPIKSTSKKQTVMERLENILNLREKGIISQDEYSKARSKILAEL